MRAQLIWKQHHHVRSFGTDLLITHRSLALGLMSVKASEALTQPCKGYIVFCIEALLSNAAHKRTWAVELRPSSGITSFFIFKALLVIAPMLLLTSCAEPQLNCALNPNIADPNSQTSPIHDPSLIRAGAHYYVYSSSALGTFIGLATYETGNAQVRYSMRCQNGYCNNCLMQITSVRRI